MGIRWDLKDMPAYDEMDILRTEGTAIPVFPNDVYKTGPPPPPPPQNIFHDPDSFSGKTYTYRLAFLSGGNLLFYSNPVKVSVPPPVIDLHGEMTSDGMKLNWHLIGKVPAEQWAVCRSGSNQNPLYPPVGADHAWVMPFNGPDGSFIDRDALAGGPLYYRVAALHNDTAFVYSNNVTSPPPR